MSAHKGSPRFTLDISDEAREAAIESNSGGCLIAEAIKAQGFTKPTVDMALIRFSDRKRGLRFHYLTPPAAQHLLLSFDQGWPLPEAEIKLARAVKVTKIVRARNGKNSPAVTEQRRQARIVELEAKEAGGRELTRHERSALTRMRNAKPAPERPSGRGRGTINSKGTVVGGNPPVSGPPHPNLLRGRNRHYGAKLADPGVAFKQAVDEGIAQRLAESDGAGA